MVALEKVNSNVEITHSNLSMCWYLTANKSIPSISMRLSCSSSFKYAMRVLHIMIFGKTAIQLANAYGRRLSYANDLIINCCQYFEIHENNNTRSPKLKYDNKIALTTSFSKRFISGVFFFSCCLLLNRRFFVKNGQIVQVPNEKKRGKKKR